jgi:hypothetical protein
MKLAIYREDKQKIIKGSLLNLLFTERKMNTAGQIILVHVVIYLFIY